jgi:prepilin-type N-terminal cleavage/methylation domain-containing protein
MKFIPYSHMYAMTLMELLISMVLVGVLAGISTMALRSAEAMKRHQANIMAQGALEEIELAYDHFLTRGGVIKDTTHVTDILANLNARKIVTDGSLSFNAINVGNSSSCDGSMYTCYVLESGTLVAARAKNLAWTVNGNNGYFMDDSVVPTTNSINGTTTQTIMIDTDAQFKWNQDQSASVKVYVDALGRIGMPSTNQPSWFSLDK